MYACMYVWVFGVIEVKSCFTFKAGEEANSKHNSLLFCIFFENYSFLHAKAPPKKAYFAWRMIIVGKIVLPKGG